MGDNSEPPRTKVLLTGFGPFGSHTVNASWVAVQEVAKEGVGNDVELITEEVPVIYDHVKSAIPQLWHTHKPQLVVHVGVSSVAEALTLEQQAHNHGYDKFDVQGACPSNCCCVAGGPANLVSQLDMQRVCQEVNTAHCGVEAVVSQDPGRYLCDFIFYTSLNQDTARSAFIHVPPLNRPYSQQQLAAGIRKAIRAMLQQLSQQGSC